MAHACLVRSMVVPQHNTTPFFPRFDVAPYALALIQPFSTGSHRSCLAGVGTLTHLLAFNHQIHNYGQYCMWFHDTFSFIRFIPGNHRY